MKIAERKRIILIIVLIAFLVLLFYNDTVCAAINTDYLGNYTVKGGNLDDALTGSTLLAMLARLIYFVGRFLEWILGVIFSMLTGTSDFPWADKIVFNSVPLLDVNFINPAYGSFVGNVNIQLVLRKIYSVILSLAATFFGMVVLITAIKLVISTIASEKAKYKQAIVDWLVGFVMLFCIHYAISFIFYLNEQLVVVASRVVKGQLKGTNAVATVQVDESVTDLINDARIKGILYDGELVADILEDNASILAVWKEEDNDNSKGLQRLIMKGLRWRQ